MSAHALSKPNAAPKGAVSESETNAAKASEQADFKRRELALRDKLKHIQPFLDNPDVTEICINKPNEVFVESRAGWECHKIPELSFNTLLQLATLVANFSNQKVNEQDSVLSATLPGGERVQVVVPPACEPNTVSFTIRKPSTVSITFDDYVKNGAFEGTKLLCKNEYVGDDPVDRKLFDIAKSGDYSLFLQEAIKLQRNILVSGATGSGKTTFTKALIMSIPSHERLIAIQNVDELDLAKTHPNHVKLFYSSGGQGLSKVTPKELMQSCMRMRPDRILLSELISGEDALYFLDSVSSGHPGSITTMHGDNPFIAVERLISMIKKTPTGSTMNTDDIRRSVYLTVDVIVQFKRVDGGNRKVTEIYYDPQYKSAQMG